ncbi:MAG TPA: metallophosphoesterase [Adhaeribacter sp.]|nr:metallophosphoesterase [Adhaeribacter sp.]
MTWNIAFWLLAAVAVVFAFAYWREWLYRHQPYYKKTVRNWAKKVPPPAPPQFSVALVGDTGNIETDGTDPVLNLISLWLENAGPNCHTVFLGDNIYPKGIPPEKDRHYQTAIAKLQAHLDIFRHIPGKVTFLGGNHDWNKGRKNGYDYALRQERHIKAALPAETAFLPPKSCLGPSVVTLLPGVLIVVLNTQWWVQRGIRPIGSGFECEYEDPEEFFTRLENILDQNQDKRILIVGHHPLYSNALHGGKFTLKQHLFPLTAANKKMYIPLPVFGSLYPFYRKFIGAYEDMSHPRYRRMRRRLLQIFHGHHNLIYAAGHDHNLQYFHYKANHFIVSGSGSKTTFVKKGGKATFTHEHKGFFIIDFYHDQTWLRVLEPGPENEIQEIFRHRIWGEIIA